MRLTPHLYFKGACEEALNFYVTCGLGKIIQLRHYAGDGLWPDKVEHAWFEGPWLRLFACDGPDAEPMKGVALSIEGDGLEAAERLFVALSEGGHVTIPFERQAWGEFYGAFTDRFGVQWAITAPLVR